MRNLIPIVFYGNLFYGLCAIALCLEANLQHKLLPNGPHFYLLVFVSTALYYTSIYYKSIRAVSSNLRTIWYCRNQRYVKRAMIIALLFIITDSAFLLFKFRSAVATLAIVQWSLMMVVPVVAFLYTCRSLPFIKIKQLRAIGWLKPFLIGFAWSGLVTVYPVLFRQMQSGTLVDQCMLPSKLFWLQNFLFISVLAILFDVKDHKTDLYFKLKTYPALLGIKRTISLVIIPLVLINLAVLLLHQWQQQASPLQQVIQFIPFILLFVVLNMVQTKRGILFYLVVIDGLMLVKALAGIVSISFF